MLLNDSTPSGSVHRYAGFLPAALRARPEIVRVIVRQVPQEEPAASLLIRRFQNRRARFQARAIE